MVDILPAPQSNQRWLDNLAYLPTPLTEQGLKLATQLNQHAETSATESRSKGLLYQDPRASASYAHHSSADKYPVILQERLARCPNPSALPSFVKPSKAFWIPPDLQLAGASDQPCGMKSSANPWNCTASELQSASLRSGDSQDQTKTFRVPALPCRRAASTSNRNECSSIQNSISLTPRDPTCPPAPLISPASTVSSVSTSSDGESDSSILNGADTIFRNKRRSTALPGRLPPSLPNQKDSSDCFVKYLMCEC